MALARETCGRECTARARPVCGCEDGGASVRSGFAAIVDGGEQPTSVGGARTTSLRSLRLRSRPTLEMGLPEGAGLRRLPYAHTCLHQVQIGVNISLGGARFSPILGYVKDRYTYPGTIRDVARAKYIKRIIAVSIFVG